MSSYTSLGDLNANRLFHLANALRAPRPGPAPQPWRPSVDATETDHGYELAVELPGMDPSEVNVVVRDGVLCLKGNRPIQPAPQGSKTHLRERVGGPWERSFTLPVDAAGDRVTATSKHGLLTVTVPKREELQAKEIHIQVA